MPYSSPLAALHACCWSTVSCDAAELARVQGEAAAKHPGAAIVVSCQRIEAYGLVACDGCGAPARFVADDALAHLAEVAAGLQSVVLGEEQILGQVRRAFEGALPELQRLARLAVASARELRRDTDFNSHAGALLDRALLAAEMAPGGTLLVLGGGQLGRLVALRGLGLGFERVVIAARTRLAPGLDPRIEYVPLSQAATLRGVAVIAGCLGSSAGEVSPEDVPHARLLADLGTPRNFGPGHEAPVVTLAGLLADERRRPHAIKRRAELTAALRAKLEARLRDSAPTSPLAALRGEAERVRQRELERMRRLHPGLDAEALEAFSRALVNQLLHRPTSRLREADARTQAEVAALFA